MAEESKIIIKTIPFKPWHTGITTLPGQYKELIVNEKAMKVLSEHPSVTHVLDTDIVGFSGMVICSPGSRNAHLWVIPTVHVAQLLDAFVASVDASLEAQAQESGVDMIFTRFDKRGLQTQLERKLVNILHLTNTRIPVDGDHLYQKIPEYCSAERHASNNLLH